MSADIRAALCECGCGAPTPIAKGTDARRGHTKGQPTRFVVGHRPGLDAGARLWAQVEQDGECWRWTGYLDPQGYGRTHVKGRTTRVHRLAYELLVGPIPDGLTLDHLCRNKWCVNPDHLDPCPRGVNTLRGTAVEMAARKRRAATTCKNGHPYTIENTRWQANGTRTCCECMRAAGRAYWRRQNQGGKAK